MSDSLIPETPARPCVLVVEDELSLRKLVSRILQNAAYDVLVAGEVAEALSLLSQHKVDVVFTDMTLPDRDGMALVREVQEHWPNKLISVSSGGARPAGLPSNVPFLAKPYSPRDLVEFLKSHQQASTPA